MTSPTEPPVDPQAPPVASPSPGASAMDEEIRQLARALNVQQQDALSGRKATIDTISLGDASTAPTVQVNLGGILIPGVRLAASYTPNVGDTVLLLKQGNEFFAAFKIQDKGTAVANSLDGGWTKVTFNSGHGHNGNSNGDVLYRRVLDNGAWKMQWQGAMTLGASDTLVSGGNALAADWRPKSRRTVVVARDATDALSVKLDFNTDGTIALVGATLGQSISSTSPGTDSALTSSYVEHSHGGAVAVAGITHNDGYHSHTVNSHSHGGATTVARPAYVTFNSIEYFL